MAGAIVILENTNILAGMLLTHHYGETSTCPSRAI